MKKSAIHFGSILFQSTYLKYEPSMSLENNHQFQILNTTHQLNLSTLLQLIHLLYPTYPNTWSTYIQYWTTPPIPIPKYKMAFKQTINWKSIKEWNEQTSLNPTQIWKDTLDLIIGQECLTSRLDRPKNIKLI
jgi:hypothetical protein